MDRTLTIKKDGKLIYSFWNYDKKEKRGGYIEKDATNFAHTLLFETCSIDEGVTLRDIFKLVNSNMSTLESVINNYCKEYVEVGLEAPFHKDEKLTSLELFWHIDLVDSSRLIGNTIPWFHGLSTEANGRVGQYALDLCSVDKIVDLPIKLSTKFALVPDDYSKTPIEYGEADFSLGQILYGIFYELSFHGSPRQQKEFEDELSKRVAQIESGEVETIPWDDLDLKQVEELDIDFKEEQS